MTSPYNIFMAAMVGIVAMTCASCGWMAGEIADKEVTDLEKDMRAEKRETVFSGSLLELGRMMQAYNVPRTPIQSKNIGNETGEKDLPSDLYTMVASAIGKIGYQVIFIPYDAQYVISESTTGGTIVRMYPQIVISGGITGYDKEMFQKERETEVSGGWAGAQGGARVNATGEAGRLCVDLNMLVYRTQSAIPGVTASNSLMLTKDSLGWGVYAYYMGNGGSFDYSLKHKQGVHAALRNLVEYSVLELVGKWAQVPYWRCIQGANPDENMIAGIKEQFQSLQKEEQALKIKNLLFLHGFNGLDRSRADFVGAEDAALREGMRRQGVSDMTELYMKLWQNVPLDTAAKRVLIDRRRQVSEARRNAETQQQQTATQANDAAIQQQQQQQEHQAKVERFNQYVTLGDRCYKENNMTGAVENYRAASGLFPGEDYPRQMIGKITAIQQKQQQIAEDYQRQMEKADRLYAAAEKESFRFAAYKEAREAYRQALQYRPDDRAAIDKISRINAVMSKYSTVNKDNGDW